MSTTRIPAYAVLVVAKAPLPGKVKTRMVPPATLEQAADIAAAALLDTLDAVLATGARPIVALDGDLTEARRSRELTELLSRCTVVGQRGDGLGERLAHAHADARTAYAEGPILQTGMDTPQVSAALLDRCAAQLTSGRADAVLGPATDGGWWALGLRDTAYADLLRDVPMSTERTGALTAEALRAAGLRVSSLPALTDVDTAADAYEVRCEIPDSRFAAATAGLRIDALEGIR